MQILRNEIELQLTSAGKLDQGSTSVLVAETAVTGSSERDSRLRFYTCRGLAPFKPVSPGLPTFLGIFITLIFFIS